MLVEKGLQAYVKKLAREMNEGYSSEDLFQQMAAHFRQHTTVTSSSSDDTSR